MRKLYTIIFVFLLVACSASSQPYGKMMYAAISDKNYGSKDYFKKIIVDICDEEKCKVLGTKYEPVDSNVFLYTIKVNNNEEIWFNDNGNRSIQLSIIQKNKSRLDEKTIKIIKQVKEEMDFKLFFSEEWVCNGSDLSYDNCTRKITEYSNIDLIEFIENKS